MGLNPEAGSENPIFPVFGQFSYLSLLLRTREGCAAAFSRGRRDLFARHGD